MADAPAAIENGEKTTTPILLAPVADGTVPAPRNKFLVTKSVRTLTPPIWLNLHLLFLRLILLEL